MECVCGIILIITFVHAILTEGWFYAFKLAGATILAVFALKITLNYINKYLDNQDSDRKD
jgi:hypothetical protein